MKWGVIKSYNNDSVYPKKKVKLDRNMVFSILIIIKGK